MTEDSVGKFNLSRDHAGKIVRIDPPVVVVRIPDGVFREGDILALFNNSNEFKTLEVEPEAYRSGSATKRTMFEMPPRGLINAIFVTDSLVAITVGT